MTVTAFEHHARRRSRLPAVLSVAALLAAGCSGPAPATKAGYANIHEAASRGDVEAVKGFLAAGVSVNELSASGAPLHSAVDNNHVAVVEFLLQNGADASLRRPRFLSDEAPVHTAAGLGFHRVVELLLVHGADVNAQKSIGNISGLTPLHETALAGNITEGHLKAAAILLENGADVNARAVMGDQAGTPLGAAVQRGHDDLAGLLRRYGGRE